MILQVVRFWIIFDQRITFIESHADDQRIGLG